MIPQLQPTELAERIAQGEELVLLDVREEVELERASLPNVTWVPLGELTMRFEELDPEAETVVVCHHGIRSMRAACFLHTQGFERVSNLRGGIDAWSQQVDPSVPRYGNH